MLPAVLDQTILATALPTIATDLGRITDLSWVVTAYVVAATASTPLWGKLGDRHGRKRLLEIALAGFIAASALCGFAQDLTQLVVVRAVQGVAAGGLMTLAMASVGDLVVAARARPLPGLHRRDVRRRDRARPARRRPARRARRLALGVLRQPAARHRRAGRPAAAAARGADERPARPLDVTGAALLAAATTRSCSPACGAGTATRWDSPTDPRADRRHRAARRCAGRPRAARARPDRAVRAAAHPSVAVASAALFLGYRRAVLGHRVRAAVPADRHRRDPDRGRPAAVPDDARHDGVDDALRALHRADRPLQALPDHRPRPDGERAGAARGRGRRRVADRHRLRPRGVRPRVRHGRRRC